MAKKLALALATLTLASSLAGCGTTGVFAGLSTQSTTTVQVKDYYSVTNAQRIASNALYRYNDLRNDWLAAYSDSQKDRIEDRMLVVLSQAIGDVRLAVSDEAGASGYDAREVFNISNYAISRYEALRRQWDMTNDINTQRWISNEMQTVMVDALQRVQTVQPYGRSVKKADAPAETPKDLKGARPTPPAPKLDKKAAK